MRSIRTIGKLTCVLAFVLKTDTKEKKIGDADNQWPANPELGYADFDAEVQFLAVALRAEATHHLADCQDQRSVLRQQE